MSLNKKKPVIVGDVYTFDFIQDICILMDDSRSDSQYRDENMSSFIFRVAKLSVESALKLLHEHKNKSTNKFEEEEREIKQSIKNKQEALEYNKKRRGENDKKIANFQRLLAGEKDSYIKEEYKRKLR